MRIFRPDNSSDPVTNLSFGQRLCFLLAVAVIIAGFSLLTLNATNPGTGSGLTRFLRIDGAFAVPSAGATLPALDSAAPAGATSIAVTIVPSNTTVSGYVVIDPGTTNCEIREISSISGGTVNIVGAGGGSFPLKYNHAAGCAVYFIHSGQIPLTLFGAVPNVNTEAIAAQNVTAFNRLSTNLHLLTANGPGHIFIPPGTFYINGECRLERDLHLTGLEGKSGLTAHSSFTFAADYSIAMIHWQRDGTPVNVTNGGPFTKIYMHGFTLEGAGITNSVGLLISSQQPGHSSDIMFRNLDRGCLVAAAQKYVMRNWVFNHCRGALTYNEAAFMYAYDFDFQQSIDFDFIGTGSQNHFIGLEIESNDTNAPTSGAHFTMGSGDNWMFKNVWFSHVTNAVTGLKFTNGFVGYPIFTLEGVRANIPSPAFRVVEDVPRGISRTVDDVNRFIQRIDSGIYTTNAWSVEITGSPNGEPDPPPKFANGITLFRRTANFGVIIRAGNGSPEGAIIADVGSLWLRTDGASNTTLYVKESGTSTTGWIPK